MSRIKPMNAVSRLRPTPMSHPTFFSAVLANEGATTSVTPDAKTFTVYVPLRLAAKPSTPEYLVPSLLIDSDAASTSTAIGAPPGPVTATALWLRMFEPDAVYSKYVPERHTTASLPGVFRVEASETE